MLGELVPVGGGDSIPMMKSELLVGRRESCDIRLRFANVSAHHCQLTLTDGYWFVRDLQSRNGIKVNDIRVVERRLDPGDVLSVAKHHYEIRYSPASVGASGPPLAPDATEDIFGKSLLERAGLANTKQMSRYKDPSQVKRINPLDASQKQLANRPDPNRPLRGD